MFNVLFSTQLILIHIEARRVFVLLKERMVNSMLIRSAKKEKQQEHRTKANREKKTNNTNKYKMQTQFEWKT